MKILVIGSSGLLGSAFKRRKKDCVYVFKDHSNLEISDRNQILKELNSLLPDVVINCTAYLGVEPCGADPMNAFAVNSKAVKDLAEICSHLNICLVHFSTDAVFDGNKGDYTEDDLPNPLNMYGMTKHVGDLFVQNICRKYYILRIPILFGMRENQGKIFIEKMHGLFKSGNKELRIADDVVSCPTFSDDVADRVLDLIESKESFGLYHLKNEGRASLYEFARVFFQQLEVSIDIKRAKARDFAAGEIEKKPLNTTIRSVKIPHMRNWTAAMEDYIVQIKHQKAGT